MNTYIRHLAVGLLLSLAAAQPSFAQKDDARAVAEAANDAFNKAFNNGDAKGLAKLYSEEATVSPGDGSAVEGRAAIEKLFTGIIGQGVHNHTIKVVEVRRNGDVAYEVAKWQASGAEKDGKTPQYSGALLKVWHRDHGTWLSTSHVWNNASQ
jgi:uncharacterized protein (TIGR02246 family)